MAGDFPRQRQGGGGHQVVISQTGFPKGYDLILGVVLAIFVLGRRAGASA
jgi:hypothetical protein